MDPPSSSISHFGTPPVCACVQGDPPQHHRFDDPDDPSHKRRIPAHITYAYKPGATIARNDDFYTLPEGGASRKVDLLFLITSAPVSTVSLPVGGSEAYAGVAMDMELAMEALSEKFPSFFKERK